MSANYKQNWKKVVGHGDFGPVLASDTFEVSVTTISGVLGHTVAGKWNMPRQAQLKDITVIATTGSLPAGQLNYALTYGGVVALSGQIHGGQSADAMFVSLDRQHAVIVASGTNVAMVYSVPSKIQDNLGTNSNPIRFSTTLDYLGKFNTGG